MPDDGKPTARDRLDALFLSHFHGELTSPNYDYLILPQILYQGQKASPGNWAIPWRELAQVPKITRPLWICAAVLSKDEAPKQELSWHQDQGLKLIIQRD